MIAAEHETSSRMARPEMREMTGEQAGEFDKKKSPSPLYAPEERKTGRDESERATEIKPLIQQQRQA